MAAIGTLAPDDAALVAAFDDTSLPLDAMTHHGHLRLAWGFLARDGAADGPISFRQALLRYVAVKGKQAIYHETLTQFWLQLVAAAMARAPAGSFAALLGSAPELLDRALPYRFYRRETLDSQAARERFVPPDLAPLPG